MKMSILNVCVSGGLAAYW